MSPSDRATVPAPIRKLRDTFGDPKPPDITRKITACVACRKQKIKCHMRDGETPCVRCKKRGLSCVVNRSLQMVLESDTLWKHSIEKKMQKFEDALRKMAHQSLTAEAVQQLELDEQDDPNCVSDNEESTDARIAPQTSFGTDHVHAEARQPEGWEVVMDLESGPSAIPGFYISQTPPAPAGSRGEDIVDRGIISLQSAQNYWEYYRDRLDHFPYRILGTHSKATLEAIRAVSPFLTAAACAVGALHLATKDFDALYKDFVALSARHSFSKRNTIDDVRALCIGAFWLSDLSWTLVSAAVRIAADLGLHKSMAKALQGDRSHYFRMRLYFLVYACDHHFSVAFGRPPLTRECEAVRSARDFLDCEHAVEDDARLVSQVLRWSICSNIFDTFGGDVERPLSNPEVHHLRRFSIALDTLRAEWAESFQPNAHVGNYPRKGVSLQYHFAKLYLCSHVFRGAESESARSRSQEVVWELEEFANSAVLSALSILKTVVADPDIQSYLDGLPIYFDTMIAFAVVFLLKVSRTLSANVQINVPEIRQLTVSLSTILKRVASTMHPQHLLVNVSRGIETIVQGYSTIGTSYRVDATDTAASHLESTSSIQALDAGIVESSRSTNDPFFLGEYDFLVDPTTSFDLDFGL